MCDQDSAFDPALVMVCWALKSLPLDSVIDGKNLVGSA